MTAALASTLSDFFPNQNTDLLTYFFIPPIFLGNITSLQIPVIRGVTHRLVTLTSSWRPDNNRTGYSILGAAPLAAARRPATPGTTALISAQKSQTTFGGHTRRQARQGTTALWLNLNPQCHRRLAQGMVDGSATKPALKQDTGYMVEKTYLDIAPYLGAFGAYLMPQ